MKHNISKAKMISEYVDAGKFYVVTFDKETKRRISTYGGVDMHKAFAEALKHIYRGHLFLILQYPDYMKPSDCFKAEQTYASALNFAARIDFTR